MSFGGFARASESGGQPPFILGLTGPSRSGKTYSALRIASGMVTDPAKIFVLDTEGGRSRLYADRFGDFTVGDLHPPFGYDAYQNAIRMAVEAGAACIIVDSMSHAHEGEGGLLDQHSAEVQRRAGEDWRKAERVKMAAWIEPKRQIARFTSFILQSTVPMIFCFRAKEKLKVLPGKQPESMGFRAITSDELTFEMTSLLLLPENARGIPDLDAPASGMREPFDSFFTAGAVLDEALGKRVAGWLRGDKPEPEPKPTENTKAAPKAGMEELETIRALLPGAQMDEATFCGHMGIERLHDLPGARVPEAVKRLYQRIDLLNKPKGQA